MLETREKSAPNGRIVSMDNHSGDIVIPRTALPAVIIHDQGARVQGARVKGPTLCAIPASTAHAAMMREAAYERLAIAEAIDRIIAEQADAKLHAEAVAICNKTVGLPFEGQSPAMNVEHWTKVARAAREVYGIK